MLRNSGGHARTHAPTFGLRYDGLYKVVTVEVKANTHGVVYRQFKLVRMTGLCDGYTQSAAEFAQIKTQSPTDTQVADYEKYRDGY